MFKRNPTLAGEFCAVVSDLSNHLTSLSLIKKDLSYLQSICLNHTSFVEFYKTVSQKSHLDIDSIAQYKFLELKNASLSELQKYKILMDVLFDQDAVNIIYATKDKVTLQRYLISWMHFSKEHF